MKPLQKSIVPLVLIPILLLSTRATKSINTDVDGGSILTLQDGELFDGIILSEKGESWFAGSEDDRTTNSTNLLPYLSAGFPAVNAPITVPVNAEEIVIPCQKEFNWNNCCIETKKEASQCYN